MALYAVPSASFYMLRLTKNTMDNTLSFRSSRDLEIWLGENHSKSDGIWLKIYKKGFNSNALRSTDVLDPLLCYGWITGQAKK